MEDKISKILSHREKRYLKTQFLKKGFKSVITVKSNCPGLDKNIYEAFILINLFKKLLPNDFIEESTLDQGADGPSYIILSNYDANIIKQATVALEDSHFLGRFIDIDVYDGDKSLSRKKMRKCYLCNEPAFVCAKKQRHTTNELSLFIIDNVLEYYKNYTKELLESSILLELNLHPKFGLVTPLTNGSHQDMNYDLMVEGKNAILPFLLKMFEVGWRNEIDDIFQIIRKIGLKAETEMFLSTKNINTYKGLIFNLGTLVSAYGYTIKKNLDINDIFNVVKDISVDILNDFKTESNSFGFIAFKKYNILGARGEVLSGFKNVKEALKYLKDYSIDSRLKTLMYLISKTEDTVLLKRCKTLEKYKKIQELFKDNIHSDINVINGINHNCIQENLSFGGSADLLILTIFLKKIGL